MERYYEGIRSLIKINFIADELALEKQKKIKKNTRTIYIGACSISFLLLAVSFLSQQSQIKSYESQIYNLKQEIEIISPHYQKAVHLYTQRNQRKKKLSNIVNDIFESSFILESLNNLAKTIPENFWLKKIHFTTLDSKKFDDNKKKKSSAIKSMVIEGQLFIDSGNENPKEVQQFQKELQSRRPFSMAKSRVDLSDLNIGKVGERYFHKFTVEFAWINFIL